MSIRCVDACRVLRQSSCSGPQLPCDPPAVVLGVAHSALPAIAQQLINASIGGEFSVAPDKPNRSAQSTGKVSMVSGAGTEGDTVLRSPDGSTLVASIFDVAGKTPQPGAIDRAFSGRWWVADDNKAYRYVGDFQFMAADGSRYVIRDDGCFHRGKTAPANQSPEGDTVLRTLDGKAVVAAVFDLLSGQTQSIDEVFANTAFLADDGQVYRYAGALTFVAASDTEIRIGDDGCFHYADDSLQTRP